MAQTPFQYCLRCCNENGANVVIYNVPLEVALEEIQE